MINKMDEWDEEWDRIPHTNSEYQKEIRELRERIQGYLKDIEIRDQLIAELKEELALVDKYWLKYNVKE
jgi:DNA repair ATPase RecN